MTKTPTGLHNHAWFAVTDAKSCRLMCCGLTRRGKHHVEEYDAFNNTRADGEHARPTTHEGMSDQVDDNERLFAGEIVAWLEKRAEQYVIDRLVIFAPPRMLGLLRTVPLGSLKGHVEEFKGDLMPLSASQLGDHPMVRELVTLHPSAEGAAFESKAMSTVGGAVGGHRTSLTGGA